MQEPAGTKLNRKEDDDVILDCEWTIWHEKQKVSTGGLTEFDYMKELSTLGAFNTLKEFWELWGSIGLQGVGTVHIFKTGIKPIWEDPANQDGGKWVVTINQEHEDHQRIMKMWFALIVAVFCGQLEYADDMCGVVFAARNWGTGLHVWNMHSGDVEKQEVVKQSLHKLLKTKKIKYIRHQTSILKNMNTSDSEGSKPRNWDRKRPHDYDSDVKSRAARSSPPTVQDGNTRPRRFSVGSESKPENIQAPKPNYAPPPKNPWNAPKQGVPASIAEEVPEPPAPTQTPISSAPTPTPTPTPSAPTPSAPSQTTSAPAPAPAKNPWNKPPPTAAAPAVASAPAPTPAAPASTPAAPASAPAPAPVASESHSPRNESAPATQAAAPAHPPANVWKAPPKKDSSSSSSQPQPHSPPQPQPQFTETSPPKQAQNVHTEKQKPKQEQKPVKSAPQPPKEKAAPPQWDGRKVIKTLETADKTDFMPIDAPVKAEKPTGKPPKNPRRTYATDPSSGEEDNHKRGAPAARAAPPAAAAAPAHAQEEAPAQAAGDAGASASTSEWSVIADKPKRKPRAGSEKEQSDREANARKRNYTQEYELLEGIEEEEEERADREREARIARAQPTQTQVSTEGESASQGEGAPKESSGGEHATSTPPSSGTEVSSTPSSKPAVRRRRELGVRHNKANNASTAPKNAENAAALAANENMKVMIIAPVAMLTILFLVYMLFF